MYKVELMFIAPKTAYIQNPPIVHKPIPGYVSNGMLYLSCISENELNLVNAERFWKELASCNEHKVDWDELFLEPRLSLNKEAVVEFAKLKVNLPPLELAELSRKIDILAFAKLAMHGLSAMHLAACLGSISLMDQAWHSYEDLNLPCQKHNCFLYGLTPLLITFRFGHLEAFKWLLENRALLNDYNSLSSILEYSDEKQRPFAELLIHHGFLRYQNRDLGHTAIHVAARINKRSLLCFLIEAGVDINMRDSSGCTPLFHAIEGQQLSMVRLLIEKGADINAQSHAQDSPLSIAIKLRQSAIVRFLLKNGAQFSATQFLYALHRGPYDTINALCKYVSRMDTEEIFRLVNSNNYKSIELLLLSKQFDINVKNNRGEPLFHYILKTKNLRLIQCCLACTKLDKKATDSEGVSPLHIAVSLKKLCLVQLLLKEGFDVNAQTQSQITPLHLAAFHDDIAIAFTLVKQGADVTKQDYLGLLPIHQAAFAQGDMHLLALLTQGANLLVAPYAVYLLYKQGRLGLAEKYYAQLDKAFKNRRREIAMRQLIAHVYEYERESTLISLDNPIQQTVIQLQGMHFDQWLHRKTIKALESLRNVTYCIKKDDKIIIKNFFPLKLLEQIISTCRFSENSFTKSSTDILMRIWSDQPTFIFTGWQNHAVQLLFVGDLIFFNNRHYPVQVRRFNSSKLDSELICKIRACKNLSEKNYKILVTEMEKKLHFHQDRITEAIEKAYNLGIQKVGNCVFASFESAIWSLITIHQIKRKIKRSFNQRISWANFYFSNLKLKIKLTLSIKYLNSHLTQTKQSGLYPDMKLSSFMTSNLKTYQIEENHPLHGLYIDHLEKFNTLIRFRSLTVYFYQHVAIIQKKGVSLSNDQMLTYEKIYEQYSLNGNF